MNLSEPWYGLVDPNVARVIRRLAILPEPMTGRRIHELSENQSLWVTQRVLRDLSAVGLVTYTRVATAKLYSLNRGHVLWEPLEQLLSAPARAEQQIGEAFANLAPTSTLALYGSTIRGDSGLDSDIDLVIVWDDDLDQDARVGVLDALDARIRTITGNQPEFFELNREMIDEMQRAHDPLLASWRRDAVTLAGSPLSAHISEEAP